MIQPENVENEKLKQLKEAAKIFLKPMERLPFPVVVEAMTGRTVNPIVERVEDLDLLEKLSAACINTVAESIKEPIFANRPNDVSTKVEGILEIMGNKTGLKVEKPKAIQGRSPGGYPDRLLWLNNEPCYLEVKVGREENIDKGSARNFFYQPTSNTKILHSARHLLAGFAIKEVSEKSWIATGWKVVDLWHLRVRLKPEYNADNLEIYKPEAVLLEGDGEKILYRKK